MCKENVSPKYAKYMGLIASCDSQFDEMKEIWHHIIRCEPFLVTHENKVEISWVQCQIAGAALYNVTGIEKYFEIVNNEVPKSKLQILGGFII